MACLIQLILSCFSFTMRIPARNQSIGLMKMNTQSVIKKFTILLSCVHTYVRM